MWIFELARTCQLRARAGEMGCFVFLCISIGRIVGKLGVIGFNLLIGPDVEISAWRLFRLGKLPRFNQSCRMPARVGPAFDRLQVFERIKAAGSVAHDRPPNGVTTSLSGISGR